MPGLAYGKGVYLASDPKFAETYGGDVGAYSVDLKNPFVMDSPVSKSFLTQFKKDFPSFNVKTYGSTGEDIHSFFPSADEANAYLISKGYDGLSNASNGFTQQTIVFDPKNIRPLTKP